MSSHSRQHQITHLCFRFDSIPSDLGIDYLKRNFEGTLGYVEAFLSNNFGPSVSEIFFRLQKALIIFQGYSFSTTSYDTLMLGFSSMDEDNLGICSSMFLVNIDR